MGCGSGKVAVTDQRDPVRPNATESNSNRDENFSKNIGDLHHTQNDVATEQNLKGKSNEGTQGESTAVNLNASVTDDEKVPPLNRIHMESITSPNAPKGAQTKRPRAVAFDVQIDDMVVVAKPLPPLSKYKPPRRLESLTNAPKLTAEELNRKLLAAEEKRNQEIERKKKKKTSKHKKNSHIKDRKDKAIELEQKLRSTDENREKLKAEIVEKQRKRREHEKKVRERAENLRKADGADVAPKSGLETYTGTDEDHPDHTWDNVNLNIDQSDISATEKQEDPSKVEERPPDNADTEDDFYGT